MMSKISPWIMEQFKQKDAKIVWLEKRVELLQGMLKRSLLEKINKALTESKNEWESEVCPQCHGKEREIAIPRVGGGVDYAKCATCGGGGRE